MAATIDTLEADLLVIGAGMAGMTAAARAARGGARVLVIGAGAIGGLLRLTTRAPVLDGVASSASAGTTLTQGGAPGYDVALMANVPLVAGKAALRGVAYQVRDGGYIDAARRRVVDANHSDTTGARLALRVDPGRYGGAGSPSGSKVDTPSAYSRLIWSPLSPRIVPKT